MRGPAILLAVLAVVLAGCGGADEPSELSDDGGSIELDESEDAAPDDAEDEGDPGTDEEAEEPAGEVEAVSAGDAGEVDVSIIDGRLELVEVRPADGWTHEIDDLDDDEIEIDFVHEDGEEIEFEVELEDGELVTELD